MISLFLLSVSDPGSLSLFKLTVGTVFLPEGLHLVLGETPVGVYLEVGDALLGALHMSVLHDEHLVLVCVLLKILWTVPRQCS